MPEMIEKKVKSALPIYCAAAAFLLAALLLPVYRLWALLVAAGLGAAAYGVGQKLFPGRTVLTQAPVRGFATGDAALDAMLTQARQDLNTLADLNKRIPNEQLSREIDRMEAAGRKILQQVEKQPQKARGIRKFVSYYLPTSIKILGTYADLLTSGAQGENVRSMMLQIQQNASTIATAFEAQLDSLFAGEVLDVSSDIAVLDGMVRGDGLTGADAVQKAAAAAPLSAADPTVPQLKL